MIAKPKLLAIGAAIVLICGLFALWAAHRRSDDAAIQRSLDVLLTARLKVRYRIESSVVNHEDTDQSGQWWVVVSQPLDGRIFSKWDSVVVPSDASDLRYYRMLIEEELSPSVPIGQFDVLLKGEATLGPGSICEHLPCNIAILLQQNKPDMFVLISKI